MLFGVASLFHSTPYKAAANLMCVIHKAVIDAGHAATLYYLIRSLTTTSQKLSQFLPLPRLTSESWNEKCGTLDKLESRMRKVFAEIFRNVRHDKPA